MQSDGVDNPDMDHEVVVIGGGPAGCSAAVFTARYGLETVVFDRGRSSIKRCAYLENYLGFPRGIDVETFYDLMHAHVREAGGEVRDHLVSGVEIRDHGRGFVLSLDEGGTVTARRVIAATRYDIDYLRPLDDDDMYETYEYRGETKEKFDRAYPEDDGSTAFDGLYVASPSTETDRQAIMAAGRGARVGHQVVEDHRRSRGYPDEFADHYDWRRRRAELDDEWRDRSRWREWFENRLQGERTVGQRGMTELMEREIDRRLASYVNDEEIAEAAEGGQRELLRLLDSELVVERAEEIRSQGLLPGSAD